MSFFIAIVGLLLLILIHEAGHFFASLAVGLRPRRFFVGFPPAIAKFKRNDIEYAVGAIPLGGLRDHPRDAPPGAARRGAAVPAGGRRGARPGRAVRAREAGPRERRVRDRRPGARRVRASRRGEAALPGRRGPRCRRVSTSSATRSGRTRTGRPRRGSGSWPSPPGPRPTSCSRSSSSRSCS